MTIESVNRRGFLRLVGGAAVTGAIAGFPRVAFGREFVPADRTRAHALVFHDPGFPEIEGVGITREVLDRAFEGSPVTYVSGHDLAEELAAGGVRVLVTAHGSAFPKDAWDAMERFLLRGGHWVNLGGRPLTVPVRWDEGAWRAEVFHTAYMRRLGITSCVPHEGIVPRAWIMKEERVSGLTETFEARGTYALSIKLTGGKDFPDEDGSAGPREAAVRPLVHGCDPEGIPVACPFVAIDRIAGRFAGGRWVFAALEGTLKPEGIRVLVTYTGERAGELIVRPSVATYRAGEKIRVSAAMQPGPALARGGSIPCEVEIFDDRGERAGSITLHLATGGGTGKGEVRVPRDNLLSPGVFTVRARAKLPGGGSGQSQICDAENGFAVTAGAVAGGAPITRDAGTWYRNGAPFPVTGTTYMAGDVHRKFLLEPNLAGWRRDFAAMKNAGVNLVRTGIWTGWSLMSGHDGSPREEVLRNFEAFLLAAREQDMPVIFTFFAFLPPAWGGVNPYLDPVAVRAQKKFVAGFARRCAGVEDVAWDLINEPSFCSSRHLWECRPNYDPHEERAWQAWLRARHKAPSDRERTARLAEGWRCTPGEVDGLPALDDFRDANFFGTKHPMKAAEYRIFAQEMFNGWIDEMTSAIRENGNPRQMVTVGQDEGGAFDRPAPRFHADRVDFTCIHSWWLNDDLLWDCVITRTPGTPHLVEETGAMWYERTDGTPWRSEREVAALLERKMALAFAGGGTGFVQWIWNTNPYMDSDNEAAIGFFRADGTAKPEFLSFRGLALWMRGQQEHFGGREEDDAVVIVPQSLLMSARDQATAATKSAVRAMAYGCGIGLCAAGEHQLGALRFIPRLVILPSPGMLTRAAWDHLRRLAGAGSTVVITGSFDHDEYGIPTGRMRELGLPPDTVPVSAEEIFAMDGVRHRARYRGERNQKILKAADGENTGRVLAVASGKGTFLWSPLPLELSDDQEPVVAMYRQALAAASLAPVLEAGGAHHGILVRAVTYAEAVLAIVVNETSRSAGLTLTQTATGFAFPVEVAPGSASYVLLRRRAPGEIARWPR